MVRRFAVILSILEALFMLADGLHAAIAGSYFAPGGQSAPWAPLAAAAGVDPSSASIKAALIVLGAALLLAALAYAFYKPRAGLYLGAVAVLTLWYLPIGTVLSLIVLACIAVSKPVQSEFPRM